MTIGIAFYVCILIENNIVPLKNFFCKAVLC
jgi:hypothetical protein